MKETAYERVLGVGEKMDAGQEHLSFQKTQVRFLASTQWPTTVHNSKSRGSETF